MNAEVIARTDVINQILATRGALFRVVLDTAYKNGGMREALLMKSEAFNLCPVLYPDTAFWDRPYLEIVEDLDEAFMQNAQNVNMDQMVNKDFIIREVLPKIVGEKEIPDLQKKGIYFKPYLDMAVMFYIPVDLPFENNSSGTVTITEQIIANVEITEEELAFAAKANAKECTSFMPMMDVLSEMMGDAVDNPEDVQTPLWVLTTSNKYLGAGLMFAEDILHTAEEKMQTNEYYILPSSIHEVLFLNKNDAPNPEELLQMVMEINATQVTPEEKLTDNVYLCSKGKVSALF